MNIDTFKPDTLIENNKGELLEVIEIKYHLEALLVTEVNKKVKFLVFIDELTN